MCVRAFALVAGRAGACLISGSLSEEEDNTRERFCVE